MPLVEITMWPGRTPDVKERLIKDVTDAVCGACGAPPEAVSVILREVAKTDWGRAGEPFSKTRPDL